MQIETTRGTFADVVANCPPEIISLAYQLRDIIAVVYPEVWEIARPAEEHIKYAIGGDQANQVLGYLCPMKDYVRLGFYFGAGLPDPAGLLVGAGKRLRHVKVRSAEQASRSEIRQLILEAIGERGAALGR
jgi:hypothetical protein